VELTAEFNPAIRYLNVGAPMPDFIIYLKVTSLPLNNSLKIFEK